MRNNPWRGKKMQRIWDQRVCRSPMLTVCISSHKTWEISFPRGLWGVSMHRGCPVLNCFSWPFSNPAQAQAAQDISCKKAKDGVLVGWRRRRLEAVKSVLLFPCHATEAAHLSCLLWVLSVFHLLFKTLGAWGRLPQVREKQEKQIHSFLISFQMERWEQKSEDSAYILCYLRGLGCNMSTGIFCVRVTAAGKENEKCESNSDIDCSIFPSQILESLPEPGCQERALSKWVQDHLNPHVCYALVLWTAVIFTLNFLHQSFTDSHVHA